MWAAVLGLGGSGNTAIVTEAMRALPVGVPKIMVSTLASGNVADFVGPTDIMMLHAVTDIAGLNAISRTVIGNAAHAAAGMVKHRVPKARKAKAAIGYTMFGVTTTCVNEIRRRLEPASESFVFHATGTGGQSFEKLADSGFLDAAFDITTTEVADYLVGGVLPCTADRFGAFIRHPIPYVGSVGACDMVNFGPRSTVPARFAGRKFHVHNAHVTPDAHDAGGECADRRLHRRAPEPHDRAGALPAAVEGCLGDRRRRRAVPRSRRRCRPVRRDPPGLGTGAEPQVAGTRPPHQRTAFAAAAVAAYKGLSKSGRR